MNQKNELKSTGRQPDVTTNQSVSPGSDVFLTGETPMDNPLFQLEAMMDFVVDRIYFKDTQSRFTRISRALAQRLGIEDPAAAIGKTDFDFMPADKAREYFEEERELFRTGSPLTNKIEKKILPDGGTSWTSTTKVPLRDRNGRIVGLVGINRDVTEQKEAEEILRQSHDELEQKVHERAEQVSRINAALQEHARERERAESAVAEERVILRALIDNLPDYIFVKDSRSRFVIINKACARQLGVAHPDDAIGKSDADFVSPELAAQYLEDERDLMSCGQIVNKEEPTQHKETGEMRWSQTTKVPLVDRDGQIKGLMGIGRDITDRKQAELRLETLHKELLEASRQAGMAEVATGVLHNVGNVLTSVNISVGMIRETTQNSKIPTLCKVSELIHQHAADLGQFITQDDKGKRLPEFIAQLADRLNQERASVLNEIASLTRDVDHIKEIVAMQQSYGRVVGVVDTVPLKDLVEDALRIHKSAFNRHDVKVITEYSPAPPVTVDRHRILQIMVNLLHNAKYACDESGRPDRQVIVRVRPNDKGGVMAQVSDNGIGIPAENLTRIFRHGFTTRAKGHGFGLHNSVLTAKELGGDLSVHSDGLGTGATFTLDLPLKPKTPEIQKA
jgi:PAS domain S-box-containing protein